MMERNRISDEQAQLLVGRPFQSAGGFEGQAHLRGKRDVSRAPASFHPSEAAWSYEEQKRAIEALRAAGASSVEGVLSK